MRARLYTILLFISAVVYAQNQSGPPERVSVSYRDGSFFVGDVIKWEANHLYIRLSTLDTIKLNRAFIKKVESSKKLSVHSKGKYHFKKGVYAYSSLSVGGGEDYSAISQVDWLVAYRHNEKMSYGVGFGTVYADASVSGLYVTHYFIPLFGYGRYYFNNSNVQPYIDFRAGYGFSNRRPWQEDDYSGGLYVVPGFGIHIASKSKLKWHIGVGQHLQSTSGNSQLFDSRGLPVFTNYDLWYNRTVLKVGIEFH